MVHRREIEDFLDDLLQPAQFKDVAPNGLQVAGKTDISTVVTGVTACQALLGQAIEEGADMALVHHGLFWDGDNPCLTGTKRQRCAMALAHDLNLFAYHLPLDAHPEVGNNAQLAKVLGIDIEGDFPWADAGQNFGNVGSLAAPCSADEFAVRLTEQLAQSPLHIAGKAEIIKQIAWCTGAAQGGLQTAIDCGVDAYISGEISEHTVHLARESGCHYFAAGHHATERYGVQAVGQLLAEQFNLSHQFIDVPNPV